uniref:Uncharacterized protein n=1 Tax=Photinus pyralis TaxID=7054 RepID=A0A1Y1LD70_PHOPY
MENNLKFGVKLLNKKDHYLRQMLEKPQLLDKYQQRHTKTIPAIINIHKLLHNENLMVDMWKCNTSMYDWEIQPAILNYIRATHRGNIQETFERYKIRHMEYNFIYTTIWHSLTSVWCANYANEEVKKWQLPNECSKLTASLISILKALETCEEDAKGKYIICSTYESGIKQLSQTLPTNALVLAILEKITNLKNKDIRIKMLYTPMQLNTYEMKAVEQPIQAASKQNNKLGTIEKIYLIDDVIASIKRKIKAKWQNLWEDSNSQMKEIVPDVTNIPRNEHLRKRDQIIWTRLAIGHTRITHSHLLLGRNRPRCPQCGEILSVRHVLQECQALQTYRQDCDVGGGLDELVNKSTFEKVIKYLETINIAREI